MPRYNQPRKTWQYRKDFKVTAVKLSYQAGIQVKHVAEGLDIHPFMLSRGRKEYGEGRLKPCTSAAPCAVNREPSVVRCCSRPFKQAERLAQTKYKPEGAQAGCCAFDVRAGMPCRRTF